METVPTFVYTSHSNYMGEKLEESPWWIFGGGKCRNACAGHGKRSDAWHECMDACKVTDIASNGDNGGGFGDFWKGLFGKPTAGSCEEQCPCSDSESWALCDSCVSECKEGKSRVGKFVEDEGGFFAVLDKLGGIFRRTRGWDTAGIGDSDWRLMAEEEKNKRLVWGGIIFVFIIAIIGFMVYMGRKKK